MPSVPMTSNRTLSWLRLSPFSGVIEISHGTYLPGWDDNSEYELWTAQYKRDGEDADTTYGLLTKRSELVVHNGSTYESDRRPSTTE